MTNILVLVAVDDRKGQTAKIRYNLPDVYKTEDSKKSQPVF